jgi:ribonuclease HI
MGPNKGSEEQESQPTKASSPQGAVIYADAGVRPVNPGCGGWGFHGYVYDITPPKKSMGPGSLALTASGYVPKSEKQVEVTPIKYFDAFGTIPHASNNGAEVLAAAQALHRLLEYGLKTVTIKTDSKYVITGAMDYLPRWRENNWCKADGQTVSNLEHWKFFDQHLTSLRNTGAEISFEWVKGHNGDQGNEKADKYATIGALASGAGENKVMTQIVEAAEYWKDEEESHPLIAHRSMYMVTNPESIVKGEYYLGNHGKDDDLLGKRMADGSYSYIQLDKADPYIELLISKQMKVSQSEDNVVLVRLDELFKSNVRKDLMTFGEDMFVPAGNKRHQTQDLKLVGGSDEEPLSERLRPPLLAMRAVEAVNFLKGMFLAWKEDRLEGVTVTDVTSFFYEDEIKAGKKGEEPKLVGKKIRSDFTSANSAVAIQAQSELGVEPLEIELVIGIDIPHRNVFKRIEKLHPKITALVWKESEKAYRYATIIETDGGKSIWCGFYTNYKYIFQNETKPTAQAEVKLEKANPKSKVADTEAAIA